MMGSAAQLTTKNTMGKLERAKELREEAQRLEAEAHAERPLPKQWRVGMRVRFLRHNDWAWSKGLEATVTKLSDDCKGRSGEDYQVFWTEPDGGGAIWWTTPDDVELVTPNCNVTGAEPAGGASGGRSC